MKYSVGRVNHQDLTRDESEIGRPVKVRRFATEAEAAAFIDQLRQRVPEEVEAGAFFLDGPEKPTRTPKTSAEGDSEHHPLKVGDFIDVHAQIVDIVSVLGEERLIVCLSGSSPQTDLCIVDPSCTSYVMEDE